MLNAEELEAFHRAMHPRGVAVLGATTGPERVGYCCLESVLVGGFPGPVYPVHPRNREILGQRVYASLAEIDGPVDLAIIALNQHATVDAVEECGERGISGAVCLAGGFKEMGEDGLALERRLADAARRHGMALFGPNTLGIFNSQASLNATFWPIRIDQARLSSISVISQSGGTGQMIVTRLIDEGLMVNKWIGVGNRATLDVADCLQYLAADDTTGVVAIFLEGTERAREFVELAAQVTPLKPVVVFKAGGSALAQQCALTHTGSMAGNYKMYRDIFEQCHLLAVDSVAEMVAACKALALAPHASGDGIGIVTPTAGPSIILVDELDRLGCRVPAFAPVTFERLAPLFEGVQVIVKNPLDAAAVGYSSESYARVAEIVLRDPGVNTLIAIGTEHKNRRFPVPELVVTQKATGKPVLVHYISTCPAGDRYRDDLHAAGIPVYTDVAEAAWGAAALARYSRARGGRRNGAR